MRDCNCSAPTGYLCGKPSCPRTIEANKNLRRLFLTIIQGGRTEQKPQERAQWPGGIDDLQF